MAIEKVKTAASEAQAKVNSMNPRDVCCKPLGFL
tara:strand:- start:191 stop:292 length:102 start_codon:yes stop_codon:yes gene_type:complete